MNKKKIVTYLFLLFCFIFRMNGQDERVMIQADSGIMGASYIAVEEAGTRFARVTSDFISSTYPASANRVITFNITFPDTGTYELYARFRVGSGTANDDSFFYGRGFGEKDTINQTDWVILNNLHPVGFSGSGNIITGEGYASTGVWKWLNLSEFTTGYEAPISFHVDEGQLNQVFQIAGRENGLDIDKLVFAPSNIYYTVLALDSGKAGSTEPPLPVGDSVGIPIADGKCKFLGSVYSYSQKVNFRAYFNQVVPENAGKWGSVEATRDVMNWAEVDSAYKLAKDNGYPFRMHVLIWGRQQPVWIATLDTSEQRLEIEEWFAAVAERYDSIDFLEVVNEPLHAPPTGTGSGYGNYMNALGGSGTTGWDWVIRAFRMARQYFPDHTKLMINEYSVENSEGSAENYVNIINLLISESLIDAIGVQAHAFSTTATSSTITNCLNILASTGLPIYATEMDIDGSTDAIQTQSYQRIFPLFWSHPSVKGITLWGYRPGLWRDAERAYLIDVDGTERQAMLWLKTYIDTALIGCPGEVTSINDPLSSENFDIKQYPNPFTNQVTIEFTLHNPEFVSYDIIDMYGRIQSYTDSELYQTGVNSLRIDGSNLNDGIYLCRFHIGDVTRNIRMVKNR